MKKVIYKTLWSKKEVELEIGYANYTNGNLAVMAFNDGEPFAHITINFSDEILPPAYAFVDDNGFPGVCEMLIENRIASDTGIFKCSGFCTYPLFKFYLEELNSDKEN